MCASTTMASLKFPFQDPLQQVASVNTATISSKLICFNKQIDLLIQQLVGGTGPGAAVAAGAASAVGIGAGPKPVVESATSVPHCR